MVFVVNKNKTPLTPCHPAKARWLLKQGYAVIHRRFPFTIRLKMQVINPVVKTYQLKIDHGAKTTGLAIVQNAAVKASVVFLAELKHRVDIKSKLDARRAMRRARRFRKTRYRAPRFNNRSRRDNWLPPSIESIVKNIETWTKRLLAICPITKIAVETVRFDTQLLDNPDISGVEYQQGTLLGYEVREYLLFRFGHTCQYCHGVSGDHVLEVEHMISKHNGGSNRIKNLTLACETCNKDKDSLNLDQWLKKLKASPKTKLNIERIKNIEKILEKGLPNFMKDAAKVNSSRKAIYRMLVRYANELEVSSGGRTKFNRAQFNLPKEHYYDALSVGTIPESFDIPKFLDVSIIKATGRGSYSRTHLDKYGFPRCYLPRKKMFYGFKSGDLVKAKISKGKNKGLWTGRVAVRSTGSFRIYFADSPNRDGISHKYCSLIQLADGYNYSRKERAHSSP